MNIQITIPTVEQEFLQLMRIVKKLDFYKKYGYDPALPNHQSFLGLLSSEDEELDDFQIKDLFVNEIYNKNYYTQGYENTTKQLNFVKKIIKQGIQILGNDFLVFSNYEIRLTAYGPGASYFFQGDKGLVIMHSTETGMFRQNAKDTIYQESQDPIATIVRAIIFLGIEDNLVQKYNLTHNEKKALIDTIFNFVFVPLLQKHNPNFNHNNRQYSDPELMKQFENAETLNLSQIVEKYIIDRRKPETEAYCILEESGFTNKEAKVYYHSLQLNSAPASTIANRCGEKRLTVYHILQDLCKKGVAHEITRDGTKQYSVMTIKKLVEYKDFENKIITKKLESLLPNFAKSTPNKNCIKTIETITGSISLISILTEIKESKIRKLQGFRTNAILDEEVGETAKKEFLALLKEQDIQCSFVCSVEEKQQVLDFFEDENEKLSLIFVSSFPIQTITLLYGQKTVAMIDQHQATITNNIAQFQSRETIISKLSK